MKRKHKKRHTLLIIYKELSVSPKEARYTFAVCQLQVSAVGRHELGRKSLFTVQALYIIGILVVKDALHIAHGLQSVQTPLCAYAALLVATERCHWREVEVIIDPD